MLVNLHWSTAQIIPPEKDTISAAEEVELLEGDTLSTLSQPLDSNAVVDNRDKIKYSKDSLDAEIDYTSEDSMILDIKNQKVHLYGNAKVTYTSLELTADYIVFDWGNNIVEAQGLPDSTGKISGNPVFKESDQAFNAKRIRYNFKTKKGLVYEATTQEKDVYVLGKVGKLHSKDESAGRSDDHIYSENAIFTTCDHPDPHFGIRSQKQKVIPNKVVVVGPSNLEVGGVPTPLWLPFGFFPLKKGDRTGLIFPRDYEFSDAWGFGLRNVGWYFPINDYMDLTVTGDIYTRGSWGLKLNSKYRKKYKWNGSLELSYSNRKAEQRGVPTVEEAYKIIWSHKQDPKAHPLNQFGGSVNIITNNFQSLTENTFEDKYQNTFRSQINYSRLFPDKPFRFSASMSHSQNTQTREVDIKLPQVDFQLTRIYPFKRKNGTGKDRWYEKISFQYSANGQNKIAATDTTLFTQQTLDDMQFGVKHTANSNASFQLFKYFNVTPGINYEEVWNFDHIQKQLNPDLVFDTTWVKFDPLADSVMVVDTVAYGTVEEMSIRGFKPRRTFNTSISVSTQIFGVRTFSKGKIRGIRHVLKPSVSFGYTPDFTDPKFGYFDYVDTDTREEFNEPERYDIFENGIYGRTSASGKSMSLSYSLNNIFEAKIWSKKDSIDKNIKIFDNFRINGDYNFAADSFQLSKVRMNGTKRFFNGITTLTLNATFDPYAYDAEEQRRINKYYWDTDRKLVRFETASIRFNTGITVDKLRGIFSGEEKSGNKQKPPPIGEESLLDIFGNFRISHQFSITGRMESSGRDTFFVSTNSISMNGSIKLTKKWSLRVGNISYDFNLKRLVYPDIGFYRDLHCWEMGMDWQPVNGTYSFYLHVKPGSLDFIKVPYNRGNQDAFRGF